MDRTDFRTPSTTSVSSTPSGLRHRLFSSGSAFSSRADRPLAGCRFAVAVAVFAGCWLQPFCRQAAISLAICYFVQPAAAVCRTVQLSVVLCSRAVLLPFAPFELFVFAIYFILGFLALYFSFIYFIYLFIAVYFFLFRRCTAVLRSSAAVKLASSGPSAVASVQSFVRPARPPYRRFCPGLPVKLSRPDSQVSQASFFQLSIRRQLCRIWACWSPGRPDRVSCPGFALRRSVFVQLFAIFIIC